MNTKEFKEKVRKHFEQFTPDELSKNFEQLVRKFNKENESPEPTPLSISLGTAKFEQYKAEYQKHLNKVHSDKITVINLFKSKVNRLLEKRNEILNDIKAGREPVILSNDIFKYYWYYTQKDWIIEILKFQSYLSEQEFEIQNKSNIPAEPKIQNKPPKKMILITPDRVKKLHSELKQYFEGREKELLKALQGFKLENRILFSGKQNQFTEVFKRLKYNGYLSNQPNDIKNWLHSNFEYHFKKGEISEVRAFNESTIHDILTKEKGEPTRKERICQPDWLPYKTESERKRE